MNSTDASINDYSETENEYSTSYTQKADALAIWNNIDEYISTDKIITYALSHYEKAVVDNDIGQIKIELAKGNTLYCANMLCGGFNQRRYGTHPSHCHNFACGKNMLWYA